MVTGLQRPNRRLEMLLILGAYQYRVCKLGPCKEIIPILEAGRIFKAIPSFKLFPPLLIRFRDGNHLKFMGMEQGIFHIVDASQPCSDEGNLNLIHPILLLFTSAYSLTLPTVIPLTKYFCRNG